MRAHNGVPAVSETPDFIPGALCRTTFNTSSPERVIIEIRPYTSPLAKAVLVAGLAFIAYWWIRIEYVAVIRPQMIRNWEIITAWWAGLFG